ncbi:MAG TPA: lysophospholipid acyltransferase family protein [Anaerolineales bacterium]|nr:lysophospholipid acyltransferase family protein [Anaerolineales bacterium]
MGILTALWRLMVFVAILIVGVVRVWLAGKKMGRNGISEAAWVINWMAKTAMKHVFGMTFSFDKPEIFMNHHGFVFPNHVSFVDIVVMLSLLPMRFLSKEEIRKWLVIGWLAESMGTVFVKRESKDSRAEAREQLGKVALYPSVVLYPEGKINHEGKELLLPFRLGAFEIAVQHHIPILPCVILYEKPEYVHWGDESIIQAGWRLFTHRTVHHVRVVPLHVIHPTGQDDSRQLAITTHASMLGILSGLGHEDEILLPDFFEE